MSSMKTYVTITVSSEGAPVSDVVKILKGMGFESTLGNHDFEYDWEGQDIVAGDVIGFVDSVQESLKGMNVRLNFTTLD